MVKNPPANTGDTRDADSIPRKGRSPGEGNGNPLQYSYMENPVISYWIHTSHVMIANLSMSEHMASHKEHPIPQPPGCSTQ